MNQFATEVLLNVASRLTGFVTCFLGRTWCLKTFYFFLATSTLAQTQSFFHHGNMTTTPHTHWTHWTPASQGLSAVYVGLNWVPPIFATAGLWVVFDMDTWRLCWRHFCPNKLFERSRPCDGHWCASGHTLKPPHWKKQLTWKDKTPRRFWQSTTIFSLEH